MKPNTNTKPNTNPVAVARHNNRNILHHHRRSWYGYRIMRNGFMLAVGLLWMARVMYFKPVSIDVYHELLAEDMALPLAFTAQSNHSRDHTRNSGATSPSGIIEVEVEVEVEDEAKEVDQHRSGTSISSPRDHEANNRNIDHPDQSEQTKSQQIHPPRYMFVHIGKTGGSTLQNNIRTLCMRTLVEKNLTRLSKQAKKAKFENREQPTPKSQKSLPKLKAVNCLKILNKQSNPKHYDPPTEMKLSTEKLVIGSIHANTKTFWWNANDFGEAPTKKHIDLPTKITGILSRGDTNAWNLEAYEPYLSTIKEDPMNVPPDFGMTDSTAFLVPVRDPIDRLVSAFNFDHPRNLAMVRHSCTTLEKSALYGYRALHAFYCLCFPTVHDLVDIYRTQGGVGNINGNVNGNGGPVRRVPSFDNTTDKTTVPCLEIAQKALRGRSHYLPEEPGFEEDLAIDLEIMNRAPVISFDHITMNYGYYYRRAMAKFPSKELVVIRTEHLWDDLQDLEHELGGTASIKGADTGHSSRTYGSHSFAVASKITASDGDSLQVLCCAILSEAKIYIELIRRASNLSAAQKKESLDAFSNRCNLELCDD